jgi:deoxycytidylate deaminase
MLISDHWHRILLETARSLATMSNCKKMKYGSIIADFNGIVISCDFNHSIRPDLCCVREGVKSGTQHEKCYALHAEGSAALRANIEGPKVCYVAGYYPDGREIKGSTYYCTSCARSLYEIGVKYIVLPTDNEQGFTILTIDEAIDSAYKVALADESMHKM